MGKTTSKVRFLKKPVIVILIISLLQMLVIGAPLSAAAPEVTLDGNTIVDTPQVFTIGSPYGWQANPPIRIHSAQTASPTGLSPAQIRHAYGFDNLTCSYTSSTWPNSGLCGSGQVIAIVDAFNDPKIASDLTTFSSTFNLPPCTTANGCFAIAMPKGKPVPNSNWALEISLDVEWAHAIAPGAKILLVEAKTNSFSNLLGAVDYSASQPGVHQVSMSWGGPEFSNEASFDNHFNVPGVSFFASSGDSGTGVIWPSVSPYVAGVGGTTLNVDSQGNVISETAWSGSGGGLSAYESEPIYQLNYPIPPSNGERGIPDVSYDANPNTGVPVLDSFSGGWFQVGGTSVGAPQWSALLGIVNSNRTTPLSSNSLTTNYLYNAATNASNYNSNNNYRDITSGSNGGCSLCNAVQGYDFVTGLGSPLANNSIPYLQTH